MTSYVFLKKLCDLLKAVIPIITTKISQLAEMILNMKLTEMKPLVIEINGNDCQVAS